MTHMTHFSRAPSPPLPSDLMDGMLRTQSGNWGLGPGWVEDAKAKRKEQEQAAKAADAKAAQDGFVALQEEVTELRIHNEGLQETLKQYEHTWAAAEERRAQSMQDAEKQSAIQLASQLEKIEELQEEVTELRIHNEGLEETLQQYEHTWTAAEERRAQAVDAEKQSKVQYAVDLEKTEELLWEEQLLQLTTAEELKKLHIVTDGLHAEVKALQEKGAKQTAFFEMERRWKASEVKAHQGKNAELVGRLEQQFAQNQKPEDDGYESPEESSDAADSFMPFVLILAAELVFIMMMSWHMSDHLWVYDATAWVYCILNSTQCNDEQN
jgi:hypothetical protein